MELDHRLFRSYMERKSEGLVGAIEQGMHTGLFDWEQCEQEPDSVRNYIQDIVLSMVKIHYEVSEPVWSGHWKPVCSRPGLRPELSINFVCVLCVRCMCAAGVHCVSTAGEASAVSTGAAYCRGDPQSLQRGGELQPQWSSARENNQCMCVWYSIECHHNMCVWYSCCTIE